MMGSQIGVEYALGGHEVSFVARRVGEASGRLEGAFGLVVETGLAGGDVVEEARGRVEVVSTLGHVGGKADLVVESVVEDIGAKRDVLREAARTMPRAILASNTSSLSITALGEMAEAPERTIGTHYWNPPLLMPLVEVIKGEGTARETVEGVVTTLRSLGKRPVVVERDVPGFVWNRLQLALLREAVWIVEEGVAAPETVDEIMRDGLARRWTLTGPFETVALGGADTFERIAANLLPVLSGEKGLAGLRRWLDDSQGTLAAVRERRDAGLARELKREREAGVGA